MWRPARARTLARQGREPQQGGRQRARTCGAVMRMPTARTARSARALSSACRHGCATRCACTARTTRPSERGCSGVSGLACRCCRGWVCCRLAIGSPHAPSSHLPPQGLSAGPAPAVAACPQLQLQGGRLGLLNRPARLGECRVGAAAARGWGGVIGRRWRRRRQQLQAGSHLPRCRAPRCSVDLARRL